MQYMSPGVIRSSLLSGMSGTVDMGRVPPSSLSLTIGESTEVEPQSEENDFLVSTFCEPRKFMLLQLSFIIAAGPFAVTLYTFSSWA